MLLHLTLGVLAFTALLVPGLCVALTWHPAPRADDEGPLMHLALALAWGFGLTPFIAFCWVVLLEVPLTPWVTLGAAALVTVLALAVFVRRGRQVPEALRHLGRPAAAVLVASALVGVVYLLKYDRSVFFLESCIHRVVMQTLRLTDTPIDILASNADDQRLGNTSVISSFVVLFRGMGFRVLYAFTGVLAALGGYLLGRRATGRRVGGWFGLILLPLNPYVARIPLLDENLLTLAYASLLLPLMLRGRQRAGAVAAGPAAQEPVPWGHVGAVLGLCVMMRHVGILWGLAVLWALWRYEGDRRRALVRAFVTFNLVTLLGHVHHAVALGSVFRFESFGQIPSFQHNFVGAYSGLLQWPFADALVRTPWNPLPTFLMWPVYLADHLGLVLFAAFLVGSVVLVRRHRDHGVFWLLWLGPAYLSLSVQENWDVPNKMGAIYILFHPFVVWAAVALAAAADRPRRIGLAIAVVALASGFGVRALRVVDVPADVRYYAAWPGEREEDPAYVRAERLLVTDVAPWPDFGRLGAAAQVLAPGKVTGLLRDLAEPTLDPVGTPYGWFPGDGVDRSLPPVVVEVHLADRPFDAPAPIVRAIDDPDAPVDLDLTAPGPPAVVPNLRVGWTPRPVSVLTTRGGAKVTGLSLVFEAWGEPGDTERLAYLHERYHRGLQMVLGWGPEDVLGARTARIDGTTLRLRVPAGPFSLVESVNNAGQNYLFWRARLRAGEPVRLEGPWRVFHN